MFLNLLIYINVPRDLGSQDPIFLHIWGHLKEEFLLASCVKDSYTDTEIMNMNVNNWLILFVRNYETVF